MVGLARRRMSTIRAACVLVCVAGAVGCSTRRTELYRTPFAWQHESSDARSVMDTEGPDVVRVTTVTGSRYVLEDAQLVGDSIGGTAVWEDDTPSQDGHHVAVRDITKLEWSHGAEGGGGFLGFVKGIGVLVGVTVLVGVAALFAL
jgi:hypothetical protein